MGSSVITLCQDTFTTGTIPEDVNRAFLCLIPKVKNTTTITQYRAISLCNMAYKIITMILVNHLKPILDQIISPTQSSFQK